MSEKDYIVETLDPKDFEEWVAHCGSIFSVGPDYFRRHFMSDPHKDYHSVFIIKDKEINKIISTVRIFHRQVYIGGKIYKMGGIGEVSTNTDYRKLGLSYKLMAAATEYMKKNDFDLSMLGTGYYSHYEKHGFKQVNYYEKIVSADLDIESADIRPLTSENFHDMAELYSEYSAKLNCSVVRTKEYWQEWCTKEIKNPHGLFIDNKLVGYICFDGNRTAEIIGDETVYDVLLSAVKPDDGKLSIPAFVKTHRKILGENTHSGTMICVYKPIEINGTVLRDTAQAVEYFNSHGGIVQWSQDGF